jgi:Spy/CpxP family protein refolding chaperone
MTTLKHALIVMVAVALCSPAWAQELRLPPGKWWENEKVVQEVGLTGEQQAKIRDLVFEHAMSMIDLKANLDRRELELANAVDRTDFDAAAVRSAFSAMQAARQKLETEHFELTIAVRQMLSPEQWQKLQALHREFQRKRAGDDRPGPDRPMGPRPGGDRPQRPR